MDVTYRDIGAGLAACLQLREQQRQDFEQKITSLWDPSGHADGHALDQDGVRPVVANFEACGDRGAG
ncbi:uncharacterized protein IUM83_14205 [Phytophthora cinnamomi]|uniref:uncharacterized protein n=1 Tax=Phytophthora cinnamomi TaxID=4785 RepID=UPI00355A7985|nr:hypothetical protein IUM83_14205 [Phytophthora cinnamomi]